MCNKEMAISQDYFPSLSDYDEKVCLFKYMSIINSLGIVYVTPFSRNWHQEIMFVNMHSRLRAFYQNSKNMFCSSIDELIKLYVLPSCINGKRPF